jgi:hypothetical protein
MVFSIPPKGSRAMLRSARRSSYRMQLERLEDRVVLSLASGTILVANSPLPGAAAPTGIIGVDPSTGAQSLVSTGGLFSLPETVRQGPNQQLYVADYSASQTGAIIGVDPNSGQQRLVATGGNINGPMALASINGFLYVGDGGAVPNLVEIDPSSGQQRLVSSGSDFSNPVGLAAAPNNSVYWADEYAFGGAGAIFSINSGQNGFKLSLFGSDPAFDREAIVREARGRRVFLSAPAHSLLLRKAAGQVPHGGGRRMLADSEEYRLIRRWIESGAPAAASNAAASVRLRVSPGNSEQALIYTDGLDAALAPFDPNSQTVPIAP